MKMKRNILLLVHVEESFRRLFPDVMYVNRLIRSCKAKKYDLVIHCTSYVEDMGPIQEIEPLIDLEIDWGWGYEPDVFEPESEDAKCVIESPYSMHEHTWVPPEFRDGIFKDAKVWLGGGSQAECLADMIAVLEHLDVDFRCVHGLIYGR